MVPNRVRLSTKNVLKQTNQRSPVKHNGFSDYPLISRMEESNGTSFVLQCRQSIFVDISLKTKSEQTTNVFEVTKLCQNNLLIYLSPISLPLYPQFFYQAFDEAVKYTQLTSLLSH